VSASTLRARFPPTVWRPPHGRTQDHMAKTRSAGAEAATAQAATPPLVPEPTNPSPSAVQPSAGTGAGPSAPEVEHTVSGIFEVSLEGLGASAQDIETLRRIRALIASKSVPAHPEQETRPSSSQMQPAQHQDAALSHAASDAIDFNIRQAERYLAAAKPGRRRNAATASRSGAARTNADTRRACCAGGPAARLAHPAGQAGSAGPMEAAERRLRRAKHRPPPR
jgi:hypothetical protein